MNKKPEKNINVQKEPKSKQQIEKIKQSPTTSKR